MLIYMLYSDIFCDLTFDECGYIFNDLRYDYFKWIWLRFAGGL